MTPIRFKAWSKVVQILCGDYQIGSIVCDNEGWYFRMSDGRSGSTKHLTWRDAANECERLYNGH